MEKMTTYGCPHCGSVEDFTECGMCDYASGVVSFDDDGQPHHTGDTEYMQSDTRRDYYLCEDCGEYFGTPVDVKTVKANARLVLTLLEAMEDCETYMTVAPTINQFKESAIAETLGKLQSAIAQAKTVNQGSETTPC